MEGDLLAFQLPPKYAPGTDLMSKWILNDKKVISLIVKSTIGQHAETEYDARPTEWTNYMRSDVFYCPHSRAKAKTLPPVLIEVQYTANGAFFRRLNEYALMIRKHQPLSPIVIIFCIHNSTEEFKGFTYDSDTMPFAKEVHCHGWAQRCYFISRETIAAHLNQHPLHPLAAIGHFLIQRKTSILNITQKDDPTIQLLYKIAKPVFEDEATKEDARQDAIVTICSKAKSQFNQATLLLEEDVPDSQARKRTIDCLADGLQLMDHLCKKYTTASSFTSSSSTPPPTTITVTPPPTTTEPALEPNDDWQFVDDYRREHGMKMSWNQCYQAGKNAGLFQSYKSIKSVQAAYYRAKRSENKQS